MTTRIVILGLAVMTVMAMASEGEHVRNTRQAGAKNADLQSYFRSFLAQLSALFRPGSPMYNVLQTFRHKSPRPQPLTNPQVVQKGPEKTCSPPCKLGHCCLLPPGAVIPTCQRPRLSGQSCSWNHHTEKNPSRTKALLRDTCPCILGTGCVSASPSKKGSCTYY